MKGAHKWADIRSSKGHAAVDENADMASAIEDDTALGCFGEATGIAPVVASLASNESCWVIAQVIEASGGYKLYPVQRNRGERADGPCAFEPAEGDLWQPRTP
ncbi:hypothetical protein [Streptomyces sp. NPDC059639]|uniref:hypothetical protein n=1 Tax=Streptomyces sp. NPDC059639 TaxID=3346891 RepID=UPI0036ACEA37